MSLPIHLVVALRHMVPCQWVHPRAGEKTSPKAPSRFFQSYTEGYMLSPLWFGF